MKGFNLIELMIVIVIFSIILGAIFATMTISGLSWYSGSTQVEMQQEVRRGLDRIVKELRQSNPTMITGVPANGIPYNSISFRLPLTDNNGDITWSNTINYSLGGLNNRQLLRTEGTNQEILANNIVGLQLTRQVSASNIIEVTLQSQKATVLGHIVATTLNSKIKFRNY
ncbi:MAG: prepilin-type N-terminal cleavage/methylation domain-containing protein [Candidatus Omnitrophica bacterium]|nr:prepilin-type N-terminal cleavage/methylation domain-containing protein [Candidatus Omnitrophota bacterium]